MGTYSSNFQGNDHGFQIGQNSGSLTAIIEAQVRPETPPRPLSTVPFPRDQQFVGRNKELHTLSRKTAVPGSRAALVGLGGVGKSQIAIEYSYRARSESVDKWVFWIHGNNADRFKQGFRDIADQAKIPGRHDPKTNIFELVQSWLRDRKREQWIIILDNMDDDTLLRKQATATGQEQQEDNQPYTAIQPLLNFIPQNSNGSIIFTSRTKEIALRVVGHDDIILVEPMMNFEALELFQKRLGHREDSPRGHQLVEQLDFMPLAIAQAAGYIRNRAPRCTILQYLERLKSSDQNAIRLLDPKTNLSSRAWEAGILSRDWEAENLILRTWMISFEHIRNARFTISDDCFSGASADEDFDYDIMILVNYSFISIVGDGTRFTMHRLVQLSVRRWLDVNSQTEHWKQIFIDSLYRKFPIDGEYEKWSVCQSLYPHVKSAMMQPPESKACSRKWAELLYRGAVYASKIGTPIDAKKMILESRNCRISLLGEEHEETLQSTSKLAFVYIDLGWFDKAEKLQTQLLETYKINLDEDHPGAMDNMANLSITLWSQGRFDEAERLQKQALEISRVNFGEQNLDTIRNMSNLASILWSQGRLDEAEKLDRQVLGIRKFKLGEDHPSTLCSMANLASTFQSQGRFDEAGELERQAIELLEVKLGEGHPETLTCMANSVLNFADQGRWDEAENLARRILKIREAKFGEDHPDTLVAMVNLGLVFSRQGRLDEAAQLEIRALDLYKDRLREDHPDALLCMTNLASTFRSQGRLQEAKRLEKQADEIHRAKLGKNNSDMPASEVMISATRKPFGRIIGTFDSLERRLVKKRKGFGMSDREFEVQFTEPSL
ncbi:hypothetical protein N7456_009203 [Penicillium angulare]|uniref:TPR-like protein n=1 Tax=Penicillium angulare TaxID=116970 RepID=A0A9W9F4E6_9EURO|nr:hypothetical protein N7456_009203 [Penicillium angulare]